MNIRKYMTLHEARVREALNGGEARSLAEVSETHDRMIGFMQHERLIHLLVLLAFSAFFLASLVLVWVRPTLPSLLLAGLFSVLLVTYIFHYYFLENAVQRWYTLADAIGQAKNPRSRLRKKRPFKVRRKPIRR